MNVIISSSVRVGSTLVSTMASALINGQSKYIAINLPHYKKGDQITLDSLPLNKLEKHCAIKTHDAPPSAFKELLDSRDDTICVIIKRNFLDTLISIWHYERYCRGSDVLLPRSKSINRILTDYPNIPDDTAVNLLIEADKPYVIRLMNDWHEYSQTIIHKHFLIVDYDRIISEGNTYLLNLLKTKIPTTIEREEKALELCSFEKMKKSFGDGFVRNGQSGEWKDVYDRQSLLIMEGLFNKLYS